MAFGLDDLEALDRGRPSSSVMPRTPTRGAALVAQLRLVEADAHALRA